MDSAPCYRSAAHGRCRPLTLTTTYLARAPGARLAPLVTRLWYIASPGPSGEPDIVCPDGTTEIVLHLGDPMRERTLAGDVSQPRYLLVGQMDRPVTLVATGRAAMVGASFIAGALFHLLPTAQDAFAGRITDAAAVWPAWTARTAEQAASCAHPDAALDVFEAALCELLPSQWQARTDPIAHAVGMLRRSGGTRSIDELAVASQLGRRQFERRFRERVGLSPRLYGRIVRFQRALAGLGRESGADIAARCGYADQAHLVREFRRFAGAVPSALVEADGWTRFFQDPRT